MTIIDIIARELAAAAKDDKEIVHIRVSTDALPGSPASVPVTPERARVLTADPRWYECALELLIHPEDHMALRRDMKPVWETAHVVGAFDGVERVYGVPVSRG